MVGHALALVAAWYAAIWPNLAASALCALWLDARAEARHIRAQHGKGKR